MLNVVRGRDNYTYRPFILAAREFVVLLVKCVIVSLHHEFVASPGQNSLERVICEIKSVLKSLLYIQTLTHRPVAHLVGDGEGDR